MDKAVENLNGDETDSTKANALMRLWENQSEVDYDGWTDAVATYPILLHPATKFQVFILYIV